MEPRSYSQEVVHLGLEPKTVTLKTILFRYRKLSVDDCSYHACYSLFRKVCIYLHLLLTTPPGVGIFGLGLKHKYPWVTSSVLSEVPQFATPHFFF